MIGRLLLLAAIVLATEITLLVWVTHRTSVLFTLLLLVGMAILGARLARVQGVRVISQFQEQLSRGVFPSDAMFDGICVLIAGILLILPGFLTDLAALFLLTPVARILIRHYFAGRFPAGQRGGANASNDWAQSGKNPFRGDAIIDVKVLDRTSENDAPGAG